MGEVYLIIIDGPMGSGKSSLAKKLRKKLGNCALLSMDIIKKFINDFHEAEKELRNFAKFEITAIISRAYLKKGISVIIEHSFGDKITVQQVLKKCKIAGVKTFVFKLDAPLELRKKRVLERDKPQRADRKKTIKKVEEDNADFSGDVKYDYDGVFDSSKESLDRIAKKIIKEVKR